MRLLNVYPTTQRKLAAIAAAALEERAGEQGTAHKRPKEAIRLEGRL
ncbi:hypothetical protein ACFVXG_27695 [Kitasatospora sp. NPDC058162]